MTTSFDPSTSAEKKLDAPENFLIRTMNDDLLNMKAGGSVETISENKAPSPAQPVAVAPEILDQETNSAKTTSPFTEVSKNELVPKEVATKEAFSENKSSSAFRFLWMLVVVLVITIVSLGAYYFSITREPAQTPEITAPIETAEVVDPVESLEVPTMPITPPEEKYSSSKPNYLTLDLATIDPAAIKSSLIAISDELRLEAGQKLYEFIVVDANNNPVVFSMFAAATGLKLSQEVLSSLGSDFSVFFYNDNTNIRLGLSILTSKTDLLKTELQKQEKTLPSDFAFLFLETKPLVSTGNFSDGVYGVHKNRYLNIDTEQGLSLDYSIDNNRLLIGTSKMTLRAILDAGSAPTMGAPIQNQNTLDDSGTSINTNKAIENTVSPQETPQIQ